MIPFQLEEEAQAITFAPLGTFCNSLFIAKLTVKSSWCIPLPDVPCAFSMPALHTLFWAVSLLTSSSSRFTSCSYCQLSSVYSLGLFLKSCPRFCAPVLLEHFCHHSNLLAGSSPSQLFGICSVWLCPWLFVCVFCTFGTRLP